MPANGDSPVDGSRSCLIYSRGSSSNISSSCAIERKLTSVPLSSARKLFLLLLRITMFGRMIRSTKFSSVLCASNKDRWLPILTTTERKPRDLLTSYGADNHSLEKQGIIFIMTETYLVVPRTHTNRTQHLPDTAHEQTQLREIIRVLQRKQLSNLTDCCADFLYRSWDIIVFLYSAMIPLMRTCLETIQNVDAPLPTALVSPTADTFRSDQIPRLWHYQR
jgi:hypothetical protein